MHCVIEVGGEGGEFDGLIAGYNLHHSNRYHILYMYMFLYVDTEYSRLMLNFDQLMVWIRNEDHF